MSILQIIITSTRPSRIGGAIGEWFAGEAQRHGGLDVRVSDLAEVGLPLLEEPEEANTGIYHHEKTRRWSETIDAADAIVFVLPEYNFTFPATVKNAIDHLYREWQYKPVALVSYGNTSGGLRSSQSLKPVLSTVKMYALPEQVTIQFAPTLVQDGRFRAADNHVAAARGVLDELTYLAPHFRRIRQERPQ